MAQNSAPVVMGTSQDVDTALGRLQRRIYGEAFRRLGLPLQWSVLPLQRLSAAVDQGQITGEVARVAGYGAEHPDLLRVDVPVYEVNWALFATDPALRLGTLAELSGKSWRATYLRGVALCKNMLEPVMPANRLMDVSTDAQGFNLLRAGRAELHCTADLSAARLQQTPEFTGVTITHRVLDVGSLPVYPYLHKRNAGLATSLAGVLRDMASEGLLARYRAEVLGDNRR